MAERLIAAYALIALLIASAAGLAAWLRYSSRAQVLARGRKRTREASKSRMAGQDE